MLTGNPEAGRALFQRRRQVQHVSFTYGRSGRYRAQIRADRPAAAISVSAPQQAAASHGDAGGRPARHGSLSNASTISTWRCATPRANIGRLRVAPQSRLMSTIRWRRIIRCSIAIPTRTYTMSSAIWSRSNEAARRSSICRERVWASDIPRSLAQLQRRHLRPPLQHAFKDQPIEHRRAFARLGLPCESRAGSASRRRERQHHHQGDARGRERRALHDNPRSRVGYRCAHRAGDLALRVAVERRLAHRQSRRGGAARNGVRRNARLQSGRARFEKREREVAHPDLRSGAVLLCFRCADNCEHRCQESRDHRRQRRRSGYSRLYRVARSGHRRARVALVRASGTGHAGSENLAERRSDAARRRHDLGAEHLRSRSQSVVFRHRQSAAGDRRDKAAKDRICTPSASSR